MIPKFKTTQIEGDEKKAYLLNLDKALSAIQTQFSLENNSYLSKKIFDFAKQENWNMLRLPKIEQTNKKISEYIGRVREEYSWLDWQIFPNEPKKNRGYFENITISPDTGLPWVFDFIQLANLKKNPSDSLKNIPSYEDLAKSFAYLMLEDKCDMSELEKKANEIHKHAMKRNFLTELMQKDSLKETGLKYSAKTEAKRIINLGGEEFWNICTLDYNKSDGIFNIYLIDLWQNNLEQAHIIANSNNVGSISKDFLNSIDGSKKNAAWYTLQTIDENFPAIQPVHVSKIAIGMFDNKYSINNKGKQNLSVSKNMIAKDQNAAILRVTRQYTYAPNQKEEDDKVKQIVYQEDWKDELLAVPAKYASEVSNAIDGSSVRIFQY